MSSVHNAAPQQTAPKQESTKPKQANARSEADTNNSESTEAAPQQDHFGPAVKVDLSAQAQASLAAKAPQPQSDAA